MSNRKYVFDIIGTEYEQWGDGEKVIISTPTGSGKTTFVIKKLLKYAASRNKHVVYYCNRKILNDQFIVQSKEQILIYFQDDKDLKDEAEQYLHIFTYQYSEKKKNYPNVYISSESGEEYTILSPDDIMYYIFDESHYFVNDALFNSNTNFWYNKFKEILVGNSYIKSVSVFLSATPKPLLTMFSRGTPLSLGDNNKLYNEFISYYKTIKYKQYTAEWFCKTFAKLCHMCMVSAKIPKVEDIMLYQKPMISHPLDG